MASSPLDRIRDQLRAKFPQAHGSRTDEAEILPQGKPLTAESFPKGAISEVVPARPGAGLALVVASLLSEPEGENPHPDIVLIDGADGFDPDSFTGAACSRLLWVRCSCAREMLHAADLVVRDGNVPFVLLDATGVPLEGLRTIPSAAWWRLSQLAGQTGGRLVVLCSRPFIPGVALRLVLSSNLTLQDFSCLRSELVERVMAQPQRLRKIT